MARWIVFDQDTAAELRSRLPQQAVFEAPGRTALEYALTAPRTVVALLETQVGNETTIAVFRPGPHYAATRPRATSTIPARSLSPSVAPAPFRAGGFLGLSDHIVMDEEEAVAEKKRWWQWWR